MPGSSDPEQQAGSAAIARSILVLAEVLASFDRVVRELHPPLLAELATGLSPVAARLDGARESLHAVPRGGDLDPLLVRIEEALAIADDARQTFADAAAQRPPGPASAAGVLTALRRVCRLREVLFPLRGLMPVLARRFAERSEELAVESLDPDPPYDAARGRTGFRVASLDGPDARGGFVLHVPESWDGERAMPLVVALHGAYGFGQDFVWTWLSETRTRGCMLLAPTSPGITWSLEAPQRDGRVLLSMVEYVRRRWPVDPEHVLLTGLSDGATFGLMIGLVEASPFTHLAPISGVLHPTALASFRTAGDRGIGPPIYLVHGALDWMFPVALARAARDALAGAGAAVTYREIADLSHTHPREENARILGWMDPRLARTWDVPVG